MKSKKIKVGLFLSNGNTKDVDLRFPEKGNPGIGGSEFTTIATAYYVNKYHSDDVEIVLLANEVELLPPSLKVYQVKDDLDAAVTSQKEGCDIFVVKASINNKQIYEQISQLNIKVIARSNNDPSIQELNRIVSCPQIKRHVCVGQEQLDNFRDHPAFVKSTRIFNPFNVENFVPKKDIIKQGNVVVFLGSIIPAKGFHCLARVWPYILKEMPQAKLIVIGRGDLYHRNIKLGKWGVAEESYEANFIRPFLSDGNGDVIESVHFAGLLGEEKIDILRNADVGVINPLGFSEICPASALEIQACGTPVVSIAKYGLLDTVIHGKTGLLGKSDKDLVRHILYLLKNPAYAKKLGENGIDFVQKKFDHRLIAKQWYELFIDVYNNKAPQSKPIEQHYFYRAKLVKEGMRVAKNSIPVLKSIPSLIEIKYFLNQVKLK